MTANTASRLLWAIAREGETYHRARFRTFTRLRAHDNSTADALPDGMARRFLSLKLGWQVLDFTDRDWTSLKGLKQSTIELDETYLNICLSYISVNAERVRNLMRIHDSCSDVMLGDNEEKIIGILGSIDTIDEQSIFIMKLQGYVKSTEDDSQFVDYIRNSKNSGWVRRRLLYPIVYHVVNTPTEDYIDTFLSYMLPQDDTGGVERAAVRHILRDDLDFEVSLAYRCYMALMAHPFDAFESLVNFAEMEFCSDGGMSDLTQRLVDYLATLFPGSRADRLLSQVRGWQRCDDGEWPSIGKLHELPGNLHDVIIRFTDCTASAPDESGLPTNEWKAICRMRWSRYPDPADFDLVSSFSRSWNFMEAGRLFAALMMSMYMVPRQPALSERRHLIRLHRFAGRTTPYLWAAPRGQWLMRKQMSAGGQWLGADLRAGIELDKQLNSEGRTWFQGVHWQLEKAERLGRVREWLSLVRKYFPIRPQYLTGIDWQWVDRVLPIARIAPFRQSPDGAYALLLRDIQEQQRDTTLLRTSIEPLRRNLSCSDFIDNLINEYGASSVAFVRFFLTPENIMLLSLAPNMTAALSERISALERCATEFKFSELLTEDQLRQEQQTLTSALMLMNVNANQFDIPWDSFKRDATNRQRDNFETHIALKLGNKTNAIINDHTVLYAHRFPNGQVKNFSLSSMWSTLAVVVLGTINAFMDHPTYGIEAILSTRFRHDTMRREFVFAFSELERSHIPGVVPAEQRELIGELSDALLAELDRWLFTHVQTIRPGFDRAFFDFSPEPEELNALVLSLRSAEAIDEVLEAVISWLTSRLEEQLAIARKDFVENLPTLFAAAVAKRASELQKETVSDPLIIGRVASAVSGAASRRVESLVEWFKMPGQGAQASLSFAEIAAAVEGRYERFVIDGRLTISTTESPETSAELGPDKVRFYFDLVSEVVQNAVKYSNKDKARVRLSPFKDGKTWGIVFSSSAARDQPKSIAISGNPYLSLSDALFREGNSGLEKIAALSASIVGQEITITARRGRAGFHLAVPLRVSDSPGAIH